MAAGTACRLKALNVCVTCRMVMNIVALLHRRPICPGIKERQREQDGSVLANSPKRKLERQMFRNPPSAVVQVRMVPV